MSLVSLVLGWFAHHLTSPDGHLVDKEHLRQIDGDTGMTNSRWLIEPEGCVPPARKRLQRNPPSRLQ